jgi:hypothetical protein
MLRPHDEEVEAEGLNCSALRIDFVGREVGSKLGG